MNLKEAFRYQNKLQALLDEAQGILDCDANVTKVANTYLRHKVMPEAEDETVMDVAQTEYAEQITDVARFMLYLMEEKSRLFAAIRKAKDALDMDMDSEVSLNAARQSIARTFKRMNVFIWKWNVDRLQPGRRNLKLSGYGIDEEAERIFHSRSQYRGRRVAQYRSDYRGIRCSRESETDLLSAGTSDRRYSDRICDGNDK